MGCLCFKQAVEVEGERYKIIKHVADGGFSSVHLVENSRTGKRYAVKRITCHSIEDQNIAITEIEINRRFSQHPNIVTLVGAELTGSADIVHDVTSEVIMVLPFYERGTLHDELERRKLSRSPLPHSCLVTMFHAISLAVRELHSTSPPLAHRDIKPHNILLSRDMTPVLMDFGSCSPARVSVRNMREAQYLQDTAAERSSMCYRPPELFQVSSSCDIDERTDIWSLGCLLYAMMCGHSPYDPVYERGDSVALAVQAGKIEFEEHGYSEDLVQLVTEMTNVDINFRINIETVIERVESLLNQNINVV